MTKKLVAVFGLYTIVTFFFLWPLPLHMSDSVINTGDPLFYAWNLMHNVQSALQGFNGLLDTPIYYPTPNTLAFSDTLFAQSLLAFPIILVTNNPILAENLSTGQTT